VRHLKEKTIGGAP